MLRVIQECQPTWVIGENVVGIESMALEQVVSDLEASGYEVAPPLEIPACSVGHDHKRARFWFLAYADQSGKPGCALDEKAPVLRGCGSDGEGMGAAHGVSSELDELRAYGNAVVPQIPEIIGRAIMKAAA
jgi:DNA (cytosine-5)-methyltransferase 1